MPDRSRPPPAPPAARPHGAGEEAHPGQAAHPPQAHHPVHGAQPPAGHHATPEAGPRRGLAAGDALYLSAMLLATLWAVVLLFVVYPQSPVDDGYDHDDVPVMSLEGNVVTVKRAQLEEALASNRYVAASREQVDYFMERRAATQDNLKQDKLFWFLATAGAPGIGLLLFRLWWQTRRRG